MTLLFVRRVTLPLSSFSGAPFRDKVLAANVIFYCNNFRLRIIEDRARDLSGVNGGHVIAKTII